MREAMRRGARESVAFARRRRGELRPRRRAVDCATMRSNGNNFRQLALRRKVTGDVLVVRGNCAKFFAWPFVRIEHDDRFVRVLLEIMEWSNKVGVARYEYDAVKIGFDVVYEHLRCDIYVGALFFCFPHGCKWNPVAGFARFFCKWEARAKTLVVALDDLKLGAVCCKRGEIHGLSHLRGRFGRVVVDTGCKILDGSYFMFVRAWQKGFGKCDDVQPLVLRKSKQPVIQVESVYINNCLFHHLSERQGPDIRPALHRIAEAQRSVYNPSRGSVGIVPNIIFGRKGVSRQDFRKAA